MVDGRRMDGEHLLNADAVRNTADGDGFLNAAMLLGNDGALKHLDTLARAFLNLHVYANSFRPEFLNRLDEIIMFKPLNKDNIGSIINLLINDVNRRLEDKELKVVLSDTAKDYIVDHGFDPMYGARPLKRYVQKSVETLAAKLILAGDVSTGDKILIDCENGTLVAKDMKS